MGSLEWATWALVVVSAVLAFATLLYAYYTKKMMDGAREQAEALKEQTEALKGQTKKLEGLTMMLHEVSVRDVLISIKKSISNLEDIIKGKT